MKKWLFSGITLFLALLLTSCAYQRINSNIDLTYESWQRHVDSNPSKWARGADSWFLDGKANAAELMNCHAPITAAISSMMVRVPNSFTNIKVNGDFQVQIVGADDNNSVDLYGPNSALREVIVNVTEDTLYLSQSEKAPCHIRNVIVRVGIKNLQSLSQAGGGLVEGRLLRSDDLSLFSSGSGNMYLGGRVNLTCVTSTGKGSINVFGAHTSGLTITTSGSGSVNICGNVGIHCITHHGCGDVNIIGANSQALSIHADGQGKIGIKGHVNIQEIDARGHTCVYAYDVVGNTTKVYVTDHARVGLAGCVNNLYVDASKAAYFWGRYLYTENAYVRAHDAAHINVTGSHKVFAAAMQNSSVYFFGPAAILTQFATESGIVMAIMDKPSNCHRSCPAFTQKSRIYKDAV